MNNRNRERKKQPKKNRKLTTKQFNSGKMYFKQIKRNIPSPSPLVSLSKYPHFSRSFNIETRGTGCLAFVLICLDIFHHDCKQNYYSDKP